MVTIDENGNSTTIEKNKCNLQKENFHGTFGDDLLKIGWDVTLPWDEFKCRVVQPIKPKCRINTWGFQVFSNVQLVYSSFFKIAK